MEKEALTLFYQLTQLSPVLGAIVLIFVLFLILKKWGLISWHISESAEENALKNHEQRQQDLNVRVSILEDRWNRDHEK